ncbi:23S rRNA (guanosine(2251)-2'-O)-methyltransferase RlmB [Flagellimonas zhangzhouensis]|uniref:23S rRNA (Guanosine2251-2'-O)-methyltransferase n=1 Tax=Flagellimonas zhangzhouensis TaxID=1073328 RepID=A0A1H2Q4X6_9FLAO|nr:23S rRNA (guanosine(2251)-2'-O)-methyltransferase RlmB [Allomuricauda zhangzhouensis]SDQ48441.1 23S rRNA (guanosine2251-2'-O)-methyltransferase [Allomuricauda zhangzhouensis]SDW02196.1 23S rRNA (guanosine2251-2'-O)-methyltransferase [Allomuricauda zhangzhouensis]
MKDSQLIYGIRAVMEAINADQPINKVFIQKGLKGELMKELESTVRKNGISASYVPIEKLNRLTRNNHQGAIAQISPVQFQDFEKMVEQIMETEKMPLFLLLDQVSDVRNFGAIIRTAECSGVHGIIVPKNGGAPITDDTVKTSAGAAFNVPIAKVDHLKDAIFYLQASGVSITAATEKTDNEIYDVDFKKPSAIIMGSEEKGINPSTLSVVDNQAKLPLMGNIGSLNVSVACGIFLYEVVRQRR